MTADETIDATRQVRDPGRDRRPHPHGAAVRRHVRQGHVRDRAPGPRPSAGRRRSSTSPSSRAASRLREGLDAWHAKAEGNAVADYGFHMIMSDVNDDTLKEMDQLVAEGVPDFKLFTAYPGVFYSDDGAIFRAMQQTGEERRADHDARRERHGDRHRRRRPRRRRQDRPATTTASPATRSSRARRRTGSSAWPRRPQVPVYIVHLSARDALNAVRDARDRGSQAFAETCPQYLFLSLDDMGNGFEGAKFVCSPPLRSADHQDELWTGLDQGRPPGRLDRPLPVRLPRPEGPRQGRLPEGPERPARRRGPGRPAPRRRRRRRPDHEGALGRDHLDGAGEAVRDVPAEGRDRGRLGRRPRRLRPERASARSAAKTHHMDVDYSCYEGREVQGGSDIVLSPRLGHRPRTASSPAGRAPAGSSSARPPTTPGWPEAGQTRACMTARDAPASTPTLGAARRGPAVRPRRSAPTRRRHGRMPRRPRPGRRRGLDQRDRPRLSRPARLARDRDRAWRTSSSS